MQRRDVPPANGCAHHLRFPHGSPRQRLAPRHWEAYSDMQRYTAAVPVLSAVRQLEYESGSAMMASNSWQSHQTDCASWPRSASMHCTV